MRLLYFKLKSCKILCFITFIKRFLKKSLKQFKYLFCVTPESTIIIYHFLDLAAANAASNGDPDLDVPFEPGGLGDGDFGFICSV